MEREYGPDNRMVAIALTNLSNMDCTWTACHAHCGFHAQDVDSVKEEDGGAVGFWVLQVSQEC